MAWYYAGPEARPVGPVSLEELHSRRATGVVQPETYVIERTGQPAETPAWKRYQELFPSPPSPPPIPPIALHLPPPPPRLVTAHPLFPSAASVPGNSSVHPGVHAPTRVTNIWCIWGFGLGLASLILLLPSCGLTSLLALPGLFISIAGLVQVHHNRNQAGRGLGISGLALSIFVLLLTIVVVGLAGPVLMKSSVQTVTEQTTSDSE